MTKSLVFSFLSLLLPAASCQASGPINLKLIRFQHRIFVDAKVGQKTVPLELDLSMEDSRIDPYLSNIMSANPVQLSIGGFSLEVPVKAALGPIGYFKVGGKDVEGYLGQNAFAGKILLFSGADRLTLFSESQWGQYRDESGLSIKGSVETDLIKLQSGLYAIPIRSNRGKTLFAELQVNGDYVHLKKSDLSAVWLGLSQEKAESGDGVAVVGGPSTWPTR